MLRSFHECSKQLHFPNTTQHTYNNQINGALNVLLICLMSQDEWPIWLKVDPIIKRVGNPSQMVIHTKHIFVTFLSTLKCYFKLPSNIYESNQETQKMK